MDIFETLKTKIGCMYISDLKFGTYKQRALELLDNLNFDNTQKTKAYNYLVG